MNIFFINIHHKSMKLPTLFLSIILLFNINIKIQTKALPRYIQNNVNDCTYLEVALDICVPFEDAYLSITSSEIINIFRDFLFSLPFTKSEPPSVAIIATGRAAKADLNGCRRRA